MSKIGEVKVKSFLLDEERSGYFVPASMKEVWAVQIELVQELLRVCNEHSLNIWADGGTLIGAVRHHGYIPWDDDIDMIMLREDYDKLIGLPSDSFSSEYFFQTAYSEQVPYPRAHAQLRKNGTAAILPGDNKKKFHQGIFIDVFPLDEVPESDDKLLKKLCRIEKYRNWAQSYYLPVRSGKMKTTVHRILRKFCCRVLSFRFCFRMWENAMREYGDQCSSSICNLSMFTSIDVVHKKTLRKEWYDETVFIPFEFITLPVPRMYDVILTTLYGDYMVPKLIPSCHGSFSVLDVHRTYEFYLKENAGR